MQLSEVEKKHKELLSQQKMEIQEIETAKSFETLRQQSKRELAEARQRAVMMDLEAQLEEQEEIDIAPVQQHQEVIPVGPEQFTGDIPRTLLYEDFLFGEGELHAFVSDDLPFPTKPHHSTPVMILHLHGNHVLPVQVQLHVESLTLLLPRLKRIQQAHIFVHQL